MPRGVGASGSRGVVGASGSGAPDLKLTLPKCIPRLQGVVGFAAAGEMVACAWRLLDRHPSLFPKGPRPSVRLAVLLGVAAKLAKADQGTVVKEIWHAFANSKFEPEIRNLEIEVVNVWAKDGLV